MLEVSELKRWTRVLAWRSRSAGRRRRLPRSKTFGGHHSLPCTAIHLDSPPAQVSFRIMLAKERTTRQTCWIMNANKRVTGGDKPQTQKE